MRETNERWEEERRDSHKPGLREMPKFFKKIHVFFSLVSFIITGGIANFTNVAETFSGIIRALTQYKDKLSARKVSMRKGRGRGRGGGRGKREEERRKKKENEGETSPNYTPVLYSLVLIFILCYLGENLRSSWWSQLPSWSANDG